MHDLKELIEKYVSLLPINGSVSYTEAERRAGEFLSILARLADWRHIFSEEKIKLTSVQLAVYAERLQAGNASTVTQNKVLAEASPEYTQAREDLERIENDLSYLKTYAEIFLNAHIFYRSVAKGNES
jgi:hypothetical protein